MKIRYEQITQALWHRYTEAATRTQIPAIGVMQFYRFYRRVRLGRMTIVPQVVRWASTPTETRALPAEITIYAWDAKLRAWERVLHKELAPPPPRKAYEIDLRGVETTHLKVECTRQHKAPPNGGEMWANEHYVPFVALHDVTFDGAERSHYDSDLPVAPPLRIRKHAPKAPRGMTVRAEEDQVTFASPAFAIGFSLRRPLLTHLGWDSAAGGKSAANLLFHRSLQLNFGDRRALVGAGDMRVISGPMWNTLDWTSHARLWGGEVSVAGNVVTYRNLSPGDGEGVTVDAEFEIRHDGFDLRLRQSTDTRRETIELEPWRFAWNAQAATVATLGMPRQEPGRTGAVDLPAAWAAVGYGNLVCRPTDGDGHAPARLQNESWRKNDVNWSGFVFDMPKSTPGTFNPGRATHERGFEFRVADVLPVGMRSPAALHPELRRNWGPGLMFRAELAGYSNNALSTNCHLSQTMVADLAAYSRPPAPGVPEPIELARYTATLALKDGRGYGDSREWYQDSDPSVLNMTGRVHQVAPNADWLEEIWPFARRATERILSKVDRRGLVVAPLSTGNAGQRGKVTNAWDCVNFGHYDAYSNAETYRAFRNVIALARAAGDNHFVKRMTAAADKMKKAYAPCFYNEKTGWLGSWRSKDGKLHDYGHYMVNMPACVYGLVPPAQARRIVARMDAQRRALGIVNFRWGVPTSIVPTRAEDFQGGYMDNPIWGKGVREDGADGFGIYCNGCLSINGAYYTLRAMSLFGQRKVVDVMIEHILEGYALGRLTGGVRTGTEFHTFEGIACGYEGTIVGEPPTLLAIALHRGLVKPLEPEFWA